MFPDSPYAVPRGSFERPVPLVLVDPCSEPTVTVRINRQWIPYILGALQQLVLQATWDTTDPDALWLVQQRAMLLLSCVGVSLDQPNCECGCADYPPSADIISWAPENPFTDPENVPAGYRFPPWYVVGGSIPFTGLQAGDVLTDLLHGPIVEPVSSGFPRLRLTCSGTGTVQITFVRFPTAGVALITVDGQIGTAKFIDLHMSLAASIGTADGEMIIPVEITTSGDHFIDITMLYSITEAPPFVHFGGAIRKVALCGFGVSPRAIPITQFVELMGDDMPVCTQLRWHDGKLQGLCCFDPATGEMTWEDIPGQGDTISQGGAQPAPEGRPGPGESKCFYVKLDGSGQWNLPFGVSAGDIITITNAKGGWSDGTVAWYCQNGQNYAGGGCFGTGHTDGADPLPTANHMTLIGIVDGVSKFDLPSSPYTVPAGAAGTQLTFQANDSTLNDNGGSITFKVCVQSGTPAPVGTWCQVFDFTVSDGGWVGCGGGGGSVYSAGNGWSGQSPNFDRDYVARDFGGSAMVTSITAEFSAGIPQAAWYVCANDMDVVCGPTSATMGDTVLTADYGAGMAMTSVALGSESASSDAFWGYLNRVTIRGTGTNPFGSSNC